MISNIAGSGLGALGTTAYSVTGGTARIFPIVGGVESDVGYECGDMEAFSFSVDVTKANRFSRETSPRTKAFSYISQVEPKAQGTFAQLGEVARAIAAMSIGSPFSQAAVPSTTITRNVRPGMTIRFGGAVGVDVDPANVKSGATVLDPAGYLVDPATGALHTNPAYVPNGVQLDANGAYPITVTYEAPAIPAGSMLGYGLFSGGGILCRLQVTEATNANFEAPPMVAELNKVLITPTGDQTWIGDGTDGLKTIAWEGEVFADPTQPQGYEYGRLYPALFPAS